MINGYMIICKETRQVRSIQGALMWDSPHNAMKALKRDCKRCGVNYDVELNNYDIIEFQAREFDKLAAMRLAGRK